MPDFFFCDILIFFFFQCFWHFRFFFLLNILIFRYFDVDKPWWFEFSVLQNIDVIGLEELALEYCAADSYSWQAFSMIRHFDVVSTFCDMSMFRCQVCRFSDTLNERCRYSYHTSKIICPRDSVRACRCFDKCQIFLFYFDILRWSTKFDVFWVARYFDDSTTVGCSYYPPDSWFDIPMFHILIFRDMSIIKLLGGFRIYQFVFFSSDYWMVEGVLLRWLARYFRYPPMFRCLDVLGATVWCLYVV